MRKPHAMIYGSWWRGVASSDSLKGSKVPKATRCAANHDEEGLRVLRIALTILAIILFAVEAHGKDTVTVFITDKLDNNAFWKNPETTVSKIQLNENGWARLVFAAKWVSDTPDVVERETYYLEYGYDDGSGRKVVLNHRKGSFQHLFKVEREITKSMGNAYFKIRMYDEGTHDLTVYIKKGEGMSAVGTNSVIVEEHKPINDVP